MVPNVVADIIVTYLFNSQLLDWISHKYTTKLDWISLSFNSSAIDLLQQNTDKINWIT